MCAYINAGNKVILLLDHCLSGVVLRMRFAREDELYRTLPICKDANQAVSIMKQKVAMFVSRGPASKTDCQRAWVKDGLGFSNLL